MTRRGSRGNPRTRGLDSLPCTCVTVPLVGGEPRFIPDAAKGDLERRFPGWQCWYVRFPGTGVTWHARPRGRQQPVVHAATPEDLAAMIGREGGGMLPSEP